MSGGVAEPLLQQTELGEQVGDGVHQRLVRRVVGGRLNAQDHFRLQRMGVLVAGEDDVGVLQQLVADHVAHGVVLLVEGVDGRIGNLSVLLTNDLLLSIEQEE